jgi:hypothetical protein
MLQGRNYQRGIMSGLNAVFTLGLLIAVFWIVFGERYWSLKQVEARRRYVDIGEKCAVAAGFVLDSVADAPEEPHPSRTFTHKLFSDLRLYIHINGWSIREALSGLVPLPEPAFKEQRGDQFSVSDFAEAVASYRDIVERRRRGEGWGCLADLRPQTSQLL